MSKGTSHKKLYLAIALIVILAVSVASAAIIYSGQHNKPKTSQITIGVSVGQTFTYNLTGVSTLFSSDANPDSQQPGFDSINNTMYTVAITGINGTVVNYSTDIMLSNGTSSEASGWVNVSSGATGGNAGFWGIYPANLLMGDLVNPADTSGPTVADVGNQTYSTSTRLINYFGVEQNATAISDPTGNTQKEEQTTVYFDQPTGILTYLQDINEYNNPEMTLTVIWQLVDTTAWQI
jgi:hypothetical protein